MYKYNEISSQLKDYSTNWSKTNYRSRPIPLERYSIFNSLNDASSYAINNTIAYEGQIIAVNESGKQIVYVLDSADDVSSTGLRRVGVLSSNELCGINDHIDERISLSVKTLSTDYQYDDNGVLLSIIQSDGKISAQFGKVKNEMLNLSNNGISQSKISNLTSDIFSLSSYKGKVYIKNPSTYLSDGNLEELSVIKIPIDQYENNLINSTLCNNVLYIVSSDYIESYGQQICNVTMQNDSYLGIAATDAFVVSVSSDITEMVYGLSDYVENEISSKFDLFKNNKVIGSNTFLSLDNFNEISSNKISCAFRNIFSTYGSALSDFLNKLDDSPYVIEIAVRENEIIKYAGLSGYPFDSYDPYNSSVLSVAYVAKKINDKITGSETELPQNFQQIKEICDNAIKLLSPNDESRNLEFRLQILRQNDDVIMNRIQILSSEFENRIKALEESIGTELQSRLTNIENKLSSIEEIFKNNTIITK